MNRNMFSPEMMNQMKSMMNPQMMKQAADTIGNMNDQQLGAYLASTGMGHISPSTFRAMSGNIKNMEDKDLERMKNNANVPPTFNPSSNFNSNSSNPGNSSSNVNTNTNMNKNGTNTNKPNYDSYEPSKPKTVIEKLEEIKNKGNEFFRKGSYKEACEKYYEALNELEYIPDSEKVNLKNQIEDLEVVCRLNIANSKLKMEDYDLVIHECLKVLKKKENFKAHYRAAVSFYKKSNYAKAKHHFIKAKEVNKTEEAQTIENYLKECERNLSEMEKEKEMEAKDKEIKNKEIEKNQNVDDKNIQEKTDNIKSNNDNVEKNVTSYIENSTVSAPKSKLEKLKEIVKSDASCKDDHSKNEKSNKKSKEDEIVIEDEKVCNKHKNNLLNEDDPNININKNSNFSSNYQSSNSYPSNSSSNSGSTTATPPYNNEMFNKAEKELSSMDDNQLNGMLGMIKTMDNATLKSMMAMQGMNLSDDQIAMMKNSMNPEMVRMMKGMKGNAMNNSNNYSPPANSYSNNSISGSSQGSSVNTTTTTATPPQMPSFPDMKNMDMSSMLKFVQDNPQIMNMMGPQMSQMFGGGAAGGVNNDMMMKSMQNIIWLMSLPSRIKAFFSSPRGLVLLGVFLVLIIAYFKN